MIQTPDDIYIRLTREKEEGKWNSLADGIRYYTRRGMEVASNKN